MANSILVDVLKLKDLHPNDLEQFQTEFVIARQVLHDQPHLIMCKPKQFARMMKAFDKEKAKRWRKIRETKPNG